MNRVRVFIIITSLTAVLVGTAIAGYFVYQNSGDRGRFRSIKQKCENIYNNDTANGNRYIAYPCSDKVLRAEFYTQYGHEYPY